MRRSMLFEHTLMRKHGEVNEAMVFGRYCVNKEGKPVASEGSGLDWVGDARDKAVKPMRFGS